MADVPTTDNKLADAVNGVLRNLITAESDVVEAAAIAEFPWLGLPVVKQLFELVLSFVSGILYQNAALAATKVIIDVQVNLEEDGANAAFQNLQLAVASGDTNAIQQATQDLNDAYARLIHYDGSSSP